jgi:hypothetical protein
MNLSLSILSLSDTDFEEYVKNRIPRLADVRPIVRAMERHGLVTSAQFRLMTQWPNPPEIRPHITSPIVTTTAGGKGITERRWLGWSDNPFSTLVLDPVLIQHFDDPGVFSREASLRGSKRKVYLAGLGILQAILVGGHALAGNTDLDDVATHWEMFELEAYGTIVEGFGANTA